MFAQDTRAPGATPAPAPPERYLLERALTIETAADNGIVPMLPQLVPQALRFMPAQFSQSTYGLLIKCRNFDGTYDAAANQAVLFGKFADPDTAEPLERQRWNAKGIPNRVSWYGNTVSPKLVVYCESRVKAIVTSLANPDWLCAGLNGVDGWSASRDKEDKVVPAENLIPPLETRTLPAVLLPDSHHHKQVRRAMAGLSAALKPHYRSVTLAKLPDPPDGRADWGADDVAAAYGPAALNLVVREQAATADGAFTLTAATEIVLRAPPLWIVRDLIPTDELSMIVGETNSGKTFLTMDALLAIARPNCTHWLGRKIKAHGPVVHITLEGRSLPYRLRAYAQHHQVLTPRDYHAIEGNVTLAEDYERLVHSMQHLHPLVIAVDTVNRALGGGDENSSADMGAFIRAAERLRLAFPGSAVVLVHHIGKDPTRGARGHSSLRASVGAELTVTEDEATGIRTVMLGKQRDGGTDFTASFRLNVVELDKDEDGEPITSCVVQPCAAPAGDAEASNLEVYRWIYAYWTATHGTKPVSKEELRRQFAKIRPKGHRMKKDEFMAAWAAVAMQGQWVRKVDGASNGQWYQLLEPPSAKF